MLGLPALRSGRDRCLAPQCDGPSRRVGRKGIGARPRQRAPPEQPRFLHPTTRRGPLGTMTAPSTLPPARLYTTWGTVLYVDSASGQLRHGAMETSPTN